jgi:beta-lactamase class A
MVLYRFLFAPVLLAVATFVGAGHGTAPRARPAPVAPRAAASAPAPLPAPVHAAPSDLPRVDPR